MNDFPAQEPVGAQPSDEIHLRDIWNLLIRNFWLITFCLIVIVGATAYYSSTVIPVYQSSVSVRIDEDRSNVPVLDILQTISSGSQVETEMEVMRSRTLAEGVVDSLRLQVFLSEPRSVAQAVLLGAIAVERWAPAAGCQLEQGASGVFSIHDMET